jgi:hypothetical protein
LCGALAWEFESVLARNCRLLPYCVAEPSLASKPAARKARARRLDFLPLVVTVPTITPTVKPQPRFPPSAYLCATGPCYSLLRQAEEKPKDVGSSTAHVCFSLSAAARLSKNATTICSRDARQQVQESFASLPLPPVAGKGRLCPSWPPTQMPDLLCPCSPFKSDAQR